MGIPIQARRIAGLLALATATLLVVVAALGVTEADAKKRKINVVQCVIGQACFGTTGRDRLVGTDSGDLIQGNLGNDVYRGNGGNDFLVDQSTTSTDTYTGYTGNSGSDTVSDHGGSADFLDLGSLKALDDVALVRGDFVTVSGSPPADDLRLDGPGSDDILIIDHFGRGSIEKIKFANFTITGTQAESMAREATQKEQAASEEHLPEDSFSGDAAHEKDEEKTSS